MFSWKKARSCYWLIRWNAEADTQVACDLDGTRVRKLSNVLYIATADRKQGATEILRCASNTHHSFNTCSISNKSPESVYLETDCACPTVEPVVIVLEFVVVEQFGPLRYIDAIPLTLWLLPHPRVALLLRHPVETITPRIAGRWVCVLPISCQSPTNIWMRRRPTNTKPILVDATL